jgi:hypothetical protein
MLLAVLWASQANTVPATFWTLAMLLLPENKVYAAAVVSQFADLVKREEGLLSAATKSSPNSADMKGGKGLSAETKLSPNSAISFAEDRSSTEPLCMNDDQLRAVAKASFQLATDRKSMISRCVAEAIRLRVHSIDLRMAAKDIALISSSGSKASTKDKDKDKCTLSILTKPLGHDTVNCKSQWTLSLLEYFNFTFYNLSILFQSTMDLKAWHWHMMLA